MNECHNLKFPKTRTKDDNCLIQGSRYMMESDRKVVRYWGRTRGNRVDSNFVFFTLDNSYLELTKEQVRNNIIKN